jgi:hypothetical protein
MAAFAPTAVVRLREPSRHAVAHRVAERFEDGVRTECGWRPETSGTLLSLRDAVASYEAFCCVRCFA